MRSIINVLSTIAISVYVICISYAKDGKYMQLRRASYCIAAKKFLPLPKTSENLFGYLLDEKSYPGEKILYVVVHQKKSRLEGSVFTVFLSDRDGTYHYDIQNNARFKLSENNNQRVFFVSPPLGGEWTQQHLVSAIKQIEKLPMITINTKDIVTNSATIDCEAYTDPQPQTSVK